MAEPIKITVPDMGGAVGVDVIEILVKEGDEIHENASLITLESDKASMEIPSPKSGVVASLALKVGDKVSEGDLILTLRETAEDPPKKAEVSKEAISQTPKPTPPEKNPPFVALPADSRDADTSLISAGPATRRLARELGVDLAAVLGSGPKSRVSKDDVMLYVKEKLNQPSSGFAAPSMPSIDFSKFGGIEIKPLNKIKKLTGSYLHRAWVTVPHVTQFDEADITTLEAFRQAEQKKTPGIKLTLLAFVCKVVTKALAVFPSFNASLDSSGEHLIYKQYYNVGIAVETSDGLVVPVIRKVEQLSVLEIAKEMARLSTKAREQGLSPQDLSGGCLTISSLGGIGGTAFTPIVNAPEVAILGLSRSSIKPVYEGGSFVPRLMLPLSLSYDHRVIDGAEAARFTRFVADGLGDLRRILL